MNNLTTNASESERVPPVVLLLIGILAGLAVTALIFCFLISKLKSCNDQARAGERKQSIVSNKVEVLTPKLKLARNSTVDSLAVSEKWRTGYDCRRQSEDILSRRQSEDILSRKQSDDILSRRKSEDILSHRQSADIFNRSYTATNGCRKQSNNVILQVVSEHNNEDNNVTEKEVTIDHKYPSKPSHLNLFIT